MSEKDVLDMNENIMFRDIVCGVIYNQDGLLLLGKRPSQRGVYRGQWGIIGGGIDEGEDAEEALLREIKEEAGLINVVISRKIDFLQEFTASKRFPDGVDKLVHMKTMYYTCIANQGEPSPNNEWEKLRWMGKKAIREIASDLNDPTRILFERIGII